MYRKLLFVFLCLLTALPALAQTNSNAAGQQFQFTLKQAIDYAITNQSKVLNAQLDERIARGKVNEIRGIGLPQVNGSVELNDFLQRPTSFFPDFISPSVYGVLIKEGVIPPSRFPQGEPALFPVQFGTKYNASAGVTASQLIFDGTYITGLQASKTFVELSSKNLQRTKIETVSDVSKAYYGVIVNEKRLGLIDANLLRLRKTQSDIKAMYEQGFVEKIDVDRLQVTVTNLEVEREKLQNFINLSYYLLKFQMGMQADARLVLTDTVSESNFTAPVVEKATYNKRIEYSLLETQRRLNTLDLQRHQMGYLPSLVAFGSLSTQAQRDEFDFFDPAGRWYATGLVGAKLSIPIFDGLQKNYRIQQSKLSIKKTENDMIMLKNAIDFEMATASLNYENAYKTLGIQRKNMELAEEIVRVAQIKYNEGVGSSLEVVTAEASLKEAQTNYYNALYDLMIAQISLQKAKGTLY